MTATFQSQLSFDVRLLSATTESDRAGPDPERDSLRDTSRVRAFFVHPAWARRGIVSRKCPESVQKVSRKCLSPDCPFLDLLALAVKHGSKLATFDQRIDPAQLTGGAAALHLIAT